MPTKYRKIFAHGDLIIPYRLRKDGVYEARVRRKALHIEVSAKDFDSLKQKFIQALQNNDRPADRQNLSQTKFGDFACKWLEVKKNLVKPSTFKEYDRLFQKNLLPSFGNCFLEDIDREKLQNYLLGFVREGKNRTAEKLSDLLRCIFDVAADDFKIPSPMAKFLFSCISECGRANLRAYASLAMSGWRSKRAKNGSAKTSFCVGPRLLPWYAKSCLISILQKRVPPISIRLLRLSNGYFRIITSTNCGIHTSAVAKSAA